VVQFGCRLRLRHGKIKGYTQTGVCPATGSAHRHEEKTMQEPDSEIVATRRDWWPQVRKFLVLQIKLYVDALRDVLISFLAFFAIVIDLIQHKTGNESYFEQLMRFGRRTEVSINLFGSYSPEQEAGRTVDSILNEIEQKLRR
jgi:hypothetical protein